MVPHGVVDAVLRDVTPLLSKGDIIIEAGNSHYKESIRRYNQMKEADILFRCGNVGRNGRRAPWSLFYGGGDPEAWEIVEPLFRDTAVRNGYLYAGEAGADIS